MAGLPKMSRNTELSCQTLLEAWVLWDAVDSFRLELTGSNLLCTSATQMLGRRLFQSGAGISSVACEASLVDV